ncbi:transcriptional regulator [Mycolicibacterium sp. GF69]|uniref:helix-turn-helix transcriptional regulator n=1 Tax=Mycolicibacterium sp. GF69 TaxID=2267251 RepID=UPI000DCBED21|nr:helix-turn-helix domain-containing protein [Mycolicibacterium sp. GF69]RAV18427.1 transcriptional regulator [Mycolicibacterium sp. GF69]
MAARREQVLAALRGAGGPLSISEVAEQLSIHPNTARFHLDALTKRGRVETVKPSQNKPGRPPLMFKVATGMDPDGPRDYRTLAGVLADELARQRDPQQRAVMAGRAWAQAETATEAAADGQDEDEGEGAVTTRRRAVDRLTDLLSEFGFAPERASAARELNEIRLRNCPFLELAEHRRDVICPVHLGLMQGALATWDAPITVETLVPFVEPGLCVAHLTPRRAVS